MRRSSPAIARHAPNLTPRQRRVMPKQRLLVSGERSAAPVTRRPFSEETLMSHTSTIRRRLGAALLATGLAGGMVLTAAPAQALPSTVCIAWTSSGSNYIDSKGNDIYVIQARCSMWLSTGGEVIDEPEKDHEIPKG